MWSSTGHAVAFQVTWPAAARGAGSLSPRRLRRRRIPLSQVVAGGGGAPWPVGAPLEPGATAVLGEPDDPQVAVLLAGWIPVADLGPHHRRRAVDGEDAGGPGEDLVRAFSLLLPHPADRVP